MRADVFLVKHGFAASRAEAQAAIAAGTVRADGTAVGKPSQALNPGMDIAYAPAHPYVSRGGVKLASALDHFALSPEGHVCLDLGASTGGFTHVLLARGAERVYAIDVGHGQLHPRIAADPRVVAREGINARDLASDVVPEAAQAIVADLSFIRLELALPPALAMAAKGAWLVALVKPQFELGPEAVGKGGIVRDPAARTGALMQFQQWLTGIAGWTVLGSMESPIAGGDGNREYLLAARRG